jgi:hypothetical protein
MVFLKLLLKLLKFINVFKLNFLIIAIALFWVNITFSQHLTHSEHATHSQDTDGGNRNFATASLESEIQPILSNAIRVGEGLRSLGSFLPESIRKGLNNLKNSKYSSHTIDSIQKLLDPFCLVEVIINPEMRVSVTQGSAKPELIQYGWRSFLVKIYNDAGTNGRLEINSPNALPVFNRSTGQHHAIKENLLEKDELQNRFLEVLLYRNAPLKSNLSGLKLEYAIVQIYSNEQGSKEAKIGFNVGEGTQDIGFRNTADILFSSNKSVKVKINVKDEVGSPTMASFIFSDNVDRFREDNKIDPYPTTDYRLTWSMLDDWEMPGFIASPEIWNGIMNGGPNFQYDSVISKSNRLIGIYPLPSRRSAWKDEYPDFYFQPQVYRSDGEHIFLPPGTYSVNFGKGPEYLKGKATIIVPSNTDSIVVNFKLKRWINLAAIGWYSADHHIHAAGCSHYESPEEGVEPDDMWRQIQGEDLNIGLNLTWGPGWYNQKKNFTGKDYLLSNKKNILHYDVEVSGFPSSHAGHLVLLNLKEDDYPNTSTIEDWPSWTLPILSWAKKQGAVVGYAHSGIGLEPETATTELPNYITPKMNGIGANEYIMSLAHNAVDIFSVGNTPPLWELNMWYHSLNAGFRPRISGETDFPCLTDERVGRYRVYAKLNERLSYDEYMSSLKKGRSYVSDGYSHLVDFKVNNQNLGDENDIKADSGENLIVAVKAAALLQIHRGEVERMIAKRKYYQGPVWHLEKARIGESRTVPVELIVNGESVDRKVILADGNWNNLIFNYKITQSSWVALRIFPSCHTNPIFIKINDRPIVKKKSVEWCLKALEKCWEKKNNNIRQSEKVDARKAYDESKIIYENLLKISN